MKHTIIVLLNVFFCIVSSAAFAEVDDNSKTYLIIKAMDSDRQIELSGDSEWTFVNRKTHDVVIIKGSNKGTKIKVLNDLAEHLKKENSIYHGEWLVAGLSEPYAGLSTAVITAKNNQIVEVNMTLKSIDVVIYAPNKTIAGTVEKISWSKPKAVEGKFTLQKKGDKALFYAAPRLFTKIYKDSIYDLRIPAIAGDYILRFYSLKNTHKAIIEKPLKVLPAKITLNAPDVAIAGTEIDLSWEAPETSQARINLKFTHNNPNFNGRYHVLTRNKNEGKLLLPSQPGDYVLRWYSVYDGQPMLERPIKLILQKVLIKAPNTAEVGEKIDISWDAPERSQGLIFIVPSDNQNIKPIEIIYTKGKKKSTLNMPTKPGKYLIRFLNESDYFVAAEHPIELIEDK